MAGVGVHSLSSALVAADESSPVQAMQSPHASLEIPSALPLAAPAALHTPVSHEAVSAEATSGRGPPEPGCRFMDIWAYLRGLKLPASCHPRSSVISCDDTSSGYWNFGVTISDHARLTAVTMALPEAVKRLNAFLAELWPQEAWNAICVSRNAFSHPHRDSANAAGSHNLTVGVGDYCGGGLWLENPQRDTNKFIPELGNSLLGSVVQTRHNPLRFPKDLWHATTPWEGDRWILTAYSMPCVPSNVLDGLGFPCPPRPDKVPSPTPSSSQAAACESTEPPCNTTLSPPKLPLGAKNWGLRTSKGTFTNHSLVRQESILAGALPFVLRTWQHPGNPPVSSWIYAQDQRDRSQLQSWLGEAQHCP